MEPSDFTDSETACDAATAIEELGRLLLPLLADTDTQRKALQLLTALQWRIEEAETRLVVMEDSLERVKNQLDQRP